jgi:hypothetical protein
MTADPMTADVSDPIETGRSATRVICDHSGAPVTTLIIATAAQSRETTSAIQVSMRTARSEASTIGVFMRFIPFNDLMASP